LEFQVRQSSNFFVTRKRLDRLGREYELILSALLLFRVKSIGNPTLHRWVLGPIVDGKMTSTFQQEGYAWPSFIPRSEDFSPIDAFPPMGRLDPQAYLSSRGIEPGQTLTLPANIEELLDAIHRLSPKDRERFLRSSYWFRHSTEVYPASRSASFAALVSAIEALVPDEPEGERCKECNQKLGGGPTRSFVKFVDDFAPDRSVKPKVRRNFYRLRSALSHGGKLLHEDHEGWGFTPKGLWDQRDLWSMQQIVRVALHNWLLEKA
jgi:hypothetical protein